MEFFQKGRKHISQKNGTTCAFSQAITGCLNTPPVEWSDPAQTSVEEARQFDKTVVSE
jgi:hydroxymethylpyrimidine/phosphomethylpyrimidine kinase